MALLDIATLGQFVPADSLIHRLDPRTKFILVLGCVILAALTLNLLNYVILLCFLILIFSFSGLSYTLLLKNLKSFIWLFVIIFLFQILFTPEPKEAIFHFSFINITPEGIHNGILYTLRFFIFILGAVVLSLTTSPVDLTDGIFSFLSPLKKLKFPVQELSLITMISLRFVPLLLEEANNLRKAQISRGASFEGGIVQKAKKTIPLLVPLFISSFKKADDLALALDARGFRSKEKRTSYRKLEFKANDYFFLGLFFIVVLVSLWIL
ncbi:MAG: hypothetical protein AMJ90_05570 [candidate division Zixibacteria bacterium SM23_73_2]|nr:MAG: hypothetical protein AMJ90_05570 [candidate division Zixibacteria bacterium SM23_73_2]